MALAVALVICAIIMCGTKYALVVHQTKPPPHIHKWWTEGTQLVNIFDPRSGSTRPISRKTHFSQSCEGCGEKRIITQDGVWKSELDGLT